MVGTLDDTPLLMVTLNKIDYFVDTANSIVFLDAPKLPVVEDMETKTAVLAMSGTL